MPRKAQSTVEYFFLIALIAAGLIAMRVYSKRALQGRLRNYADQLSEGNFYSPGAVQRGVLRRTTETQERLVTQGQARVTAVPLPKDASQTSVTLHQETQRQEEVAALEEEPLRR